MFATSMVSAAWKSAAILGVFFLCTVPAATPALGADTTAVHADDHNHDSATHAPGSDEHEHLGKKLKIWTVLPFIAILLCIAVLPLTAPHWWEHNTNRAIIAAALALPVAAYLYFVHGHDGIHALEHSALEYISFILLLGSLYVITGGIYVQGSLAGTPIVNTLVMALGALMASFIGTTGASVLLIRPLLRANAPRERKAHVVVFFIFIVSNCGGLLTPLGDPPLFLGFLRGVPFTWTLTLWDPLESTCRHASLSIL